MALEMDPQYMHASKRLQSIHQHVEHLSRKNGQLRLEVAFYRECFQHAERFKDTVTQLSQDLLHECIIGLLNSAPLEDVQINSGSALDEIKNISRSLSNAVDDLQRKQNEALGTFVAPYRARTTELQQSPFNDMI
jgi:regulator of replication initiation timing